MAYLTSNIPYTRFGLEKNLHMDIKNTTVNFCTDWQSRLQQCPTDALVFRSSSPDVKQMEQKTVIYVTGGAMWARMPITALCGDITFDDGLKKWKQPCSTVGLSITPSHRWNFIRCKPSPWLCKIDGDFYMENGYSLSTIGESEIADCPTTTQTESCYCVN